MIGISLLSLPLDVRNRIYYHCGISKSSPLPLQRPYCRECWKATSSATGNEIDRDPYSGVNLSDLPSYQRARGVYPEILERFGRTSNALCLDATAYFYSSNAFTLVFQNASALKNLLDLPPLFLVSITSLLIRYGYPYEETEGLGRLVRRCDSCHRHIPVSNKMLTCISEEDLAIVRTWDSVCKTLAKIIQPGRLDLTFICDTDDEIVARQLSRSIMRLPLLKSCAIRLSRFPDHIWNTIAYETAEKLMTTQVSSKSFPYFKLSPELRYQILGYTHLSPTAGKFDPRFKKLNALAQHKCFRPPSQFWCCYHCVNIQVDGCCCPGMRGAYSAFCSCRFVPISLFLVSKQMRFEALHVLCKLNCLWFRSHLPSTIACLQGTFRDHLWSIRHMQFSFSRVQLSEGIQNTFLQWRALVRLIKNNFTLHNLCLTINLLDTFDGDAYSFEDTKRYFYNAYCEIVLELSILDGLEDLHVELPWPKQLERVLEQEIMGPEYDSHSGNRIAKPKCSSAEWSFAAEEHIEMLPQWHDEAWEAARNKYARMTDGLVPQVTNGDHREK